MKRPNLILTMPYPYTAGIITVIWIGGVILVSLPIGLSLTTVLISNAVMSLVIARVGFRN